MSVDKFKFVSPGIFIDEIDESSIPALPERMGPLVIGRFAKGPGKRPIKVNSFKEFIQLFGNPSPGNASSDIWRTGDLTAPTYAAYAVKAWLRNNSPCTVYRVVGESHTQADDTDAGNPGWNTTKDFSEPKLTGSDIGGAYGLFVFPSASADTKVQGSLAAVWYVNNGYVQLSGTDRGGTGSLAAGSLISAGSGRKFTALIKDKLGSIVKTSQFNFDKDSDLFIRKVFNTDPTKTNGEIVPTTSTTQSYWLGETFENNLIGGRQNSKLVKDPDGSDRSIIGDADDTFGVILALDGTAGSADNLVWANHEINARAAQTGWFISQDIRGAESAGFNPSSHTEKLFKFHALDSGEHANRDFKVSITNIRVPTDNYNNYGTFDVLVRKGSDNDSTPIILERYSGCNLNPTSANYIGRRIGDKYFTYDEDNKRIIDHGDNENMSSILRVEVTDLVRDGGASGLNPFGVYGPAVPKTHDLTNATTASTLLAAGSGSSNALPIDSLHSGHHSTGSMIFTGWPKDGDGVLAFTGSVVFPTTRLRVSSSEGNFPQGSRAYFGYQANIVDTRRFDKTNLDLLRGQPSGLDPTANAAADSLLQYSWIFTLDDVKKDGTDPENHAIWVSGSRADNTSFTAVSSSGNATTGEPEVLAQGYNKFTSPMFGGFDGFDIMEQDPLANRNISEGATEKNNRVYYSLKKAIDLTSDPDFIEYDIACMPGITNTSINTQLVNSCEDRADSLAIIDLPNGYKPPHERKTPESDNVGSVTDTVKSLKDMNLNSSYGCAFYPWVKIRDNVADAVLYVPPSVVALGTMSSAQRKSAVWFAPAGFTRGGLSEGSAGLPVLGVRQRLVSSERDKLYDANINPIASFPAEGIVIFGQKTLQVTASALDRINVRRLLIFLKKEISRIASTILFDQNVQQTWDRFLGQVNPFLEGVQAGLGLTDYKVILDDTTTTPDLVDRNILYAKIFLKPARAIEFIALDFIITRSGESFDD